MLLSTKSRLSPLLARLAPHIVAAAWIIAVDNPVHANTLEGRKITYHKIYDGWWDVACDTDVRGADMRCYIQYVDPYRPHPHFRAAMVEFIHVPDGKGATIPEMTFDIEPDLKIADSTIVAVDAGGEETAIALHHCAGNSCTFRGRDVEAAIAAWSKADRLTLRIMESDGREIVRNWPLGSFAKLWSDYLAQRKARGMR